MRLDPKTTCTSLLALATALALGGCAAEDATDLPPDVGEQASSLTSHQMTLWLQPTIVIQGPIPYRATFGPIHTGARLTKINFPTQYAPFLLLRAGHNSGECYSNPSATMYVHGDMTAAQLQEYFGSTTPTISGLQTIEFVGCSAGSPVGGNLPAHPINLQWDDLSEPNPPHPHPQPQPQPQRPPSNPHPNTCRSAPLRPGSRVRTDVSASWQNGNVVEVAIYGSLGNQFTDYNDWVSSDNVYRHDQVSGDFNGDGLADLASFSSADGRNVIRVRLSTSSSFMVSTWSSSAGQAHDKVQWVPGDYDGDGLTDIAELWKDGDLLSITVHRSTGAGFAPAAAWTIRDGGWGDTIKWSSGYFDSDNKADILGVWNNGGQNTLTVRRSTGSSFTHEHWGINMGGWMDSTEWLPGDYNGDGLTDVAAVWNNGGAVNIAVYPSTGHSFSGWSQWAERQGGFINGAKWSSGDYDGDGKADLFVAWAQNDRNVLTVRRSTGSSFTHEHWRLSQGGWNDENAWCSGKFRP
jgi:FG-GAP-like repeat